jgi:purine-binding chemotaxis protein CheW
MSPQKKKKLEAAIDNLFSSPRIKNGQNQGIQSTIDPKVDENLSGSSSQEESFPQPANSTPIIVEAETVPAVITSAPALEVFPVPELVEIAPAKTPIVLTQTNPSMEPIKSTDSSIALPTLENVQVNGEGVQMVIFLLDGQYYGIGIETVDSIIKMQAITELPHAPHFIVGLTNLRGKVLPVISLRKRFGLADQETTKNSRIIVINVEQKEAGLIVDGVSEVETIPRKNIEATPSMTAPNASRPIEGIAKLDERLIILLNLSKVILPVGS